MSVDRFEKVPGIDLETAGKYVLATDLINRGGEPLLPSGHIPSDIIIGERVLFELDFPKFILEAFPDTKAVEYQRLTPSRGSNHWEEIHWPWNIHKGLLMVPQDVGDGEYWRFWLDFHGSYSDSNCPEINLKRFETPDLTSPEYPNLRRVKGVGSINIHLWGSDMERQDDRGEYWNGVIKIDDKPTRVLQEVIERMNSVLVGREIPVWRDKS